MKEINFGDYGCNDYIELLESFEYEILAKAEDEDYQGDSVVAFKNNDKYGFLIFGWGSCSGCDALLACNTKEEVYQLRDDLHNDILWFDSKQSLIDYIKNKDWELSFIHINLIDEILNELTYEVSK